MGNGETRCRKDSILGMCFSAQVRMADLEYFPFVVYGTVPCCSYILLETGGIWSRKLGR